MASTAMRGAFCCSELGIVAADDLTTFVGATDGAGAMGKSRLAAFTIHNVRCGNVIVRTAHALAGPGCLFLGNCHDVYLVKLVVIVLIKLLTDGKYNPPAKRVTLSSDCGKPQASRRPLPDRTRIFAN